MKDFNIIELLMSSIENELNIPCFYMFCDEELLTPYAIIKIEERENSIFDNESISDYYNVEVTLWYTSAKDVMLYQKIKKKLKEKGFIYENSWDLIDENSSNITQTTTYYGKLMSYKYKNYTKM